MYTYKPSLTTRIKILIPSVTVPHGIHTTVNSHVVSTAPYKAVGLREPGCVVRKCVPMCAVQMAQHYMHLKPTMTVRYQQCMLVKEDQRDTVTQRERGSFNTVLGRVRCYSTTKATININC